MARERIQAISNAASSPDPQVPTTPWQRRLPIEFRDSERERGSETQLSRLVSGDATHTRVGGPGAPGPLRGNKAAA